MVKKAKAAAVKPGHGPTEELIKEELAQIGNNPPTSKELREVRYMETEAMDQDFKNLLLAFRRANKKALKPLGRVPTSLVQQWHAKFKFKRENSVIHAWHIAPKRSMPMVDEELARYVISDTEALIRAYEIVPEVVQDQWVFGRNCPTHLLPSNMAMIEASIRKVQTCSAAENQAPRAARALPAAPLAVQDAGGDESSSSDGPSEAAAVAAPASTKGGSRDGTPTVSKISSATSAADQAPRDVPTEPPPTDTLKDCWTNIERLATVGKWCGVDDVDVECASFWIKVLCDFKPPQLDHSDEASRRDRVMKKVVDLMLASATWDDIVRMMRRRKGKDGTGGSTVQPAAAGPAADGQLADQPGQPKIGSATDGMKESSKIGSATDGQLVDQEGIKQQSSLDQSTATVSASAGKFTSR